MSMNESRESRITKYWIRRTWRMTKLLLAVFVLFLVFSGLVYVVPKIWAFAIGG